jgi:hypothetical protein
VSREHSDCVHLSEGQFGALAELLTEIRDELRSLTPILKHPLVSTQSAAPHQFWPGEGAYFYHRECPCQACVWTAQLQRESRR